MAKTTVEKAIDLKNWEIAVSDMMKITQNPNYKYTNPNNKYYYFTDHMKGWMQGLFGLVDGEDGLVEIDPGELNNEQKAMAPLVQGFTYMKENWWDVALKGEKHPEYYPLPTLEANLKPEEVATLKGEVYDRLLPAYRALKESFEKRWWFEVIFNHRQYAAERDSLKVMTNMILSMTGDSMKQLEEKYEAFKVEVPVSNIAKVTKLTVEREQIAKNYAENEKELEKVKMFEMGMEEYEKKKQQQQEEEIENATNKKANELTTKDQFAICTTDGVFGNKVKDDIKAVLLQHGAQERLLKLMLDAQFYKPMMQEAGNICDRFDGAIEESADKAEMNKIVNEGANNIFKVALKATAFVRITDAQTRITLAQKLTDIVLNAASPVAFKQQEYGIYGKGHVVLQNEKLISDELKGSYTYDALQEAITATKETFGELYPENKVQEIEQITVDLFEPKVDVVPPADKMPVEINAPKLDK